MYLAHLHQRDTESKDLFITRWLGMARLGAVPPLAICNVLVEKVIGKLCGSTLSRNES